MKLKDSINLWLKSALNDPVAEILHKNSHLTKIQLETLLIDILAENISGKSLKYDEKASLRLTREKISRGAFNRTLRQAKGNIIKSIYTILLLGYLGVFESSALDPYIEISNKLKTYIEAHKNISGSRAETADRLKIMKIMREELESGLKKLSRSSSLSA